MKKTRKWTVVLGVVAVVVLAVLVAVRVDYDESRGVWNVDGFGLSAVCLNDRQTGLNCWLDVGGDFVRQWPEPPTPYPTATPYPTSTPYPTYTPPGMQSA